MTQTWLGIGQIDLPEGWELHSQHTLSEPPPPDQVAGANLVISRVEVAFEDVESAIEGVYEEIASAVPNLERGATDELTFADGVAGYRVDVSFLVGPEQRIIQRHAVRLDGATLTHFVLSLDITQQARLAELEPLLNSFSADAPST